jgi:UDP-N-acetylglucosamine--N-acetylmuramyl-(pentapeptide) pyrophosphoryl-undecaprenol N-acetylglucosamine transferase
MYSVKNRSLRVIIGGGGTGGHIFPALAIATEIRKRMPDSEILFVGAEGRMEMTRVPEAGFEIVGLPIAGLQRRLDPANLKLPFRLFSSVQKAIGLVRSFRPDVCVGVGGYASAPLLLAARVLGVPYLIQEQNSFAGLTNKLLGRKAKLICVAFPEMQRYFPGEKLRETGNPVRSDLLDLHISPFEALRHFGLEPGVQTVLVLGGSLGARTINEAVYEALPGWAEKGFQVIWQTGNAFSAKAAARIAETGKPGLVTFPFIREMQMAYAAADVVVSRAGALSLAEICITGKASILVPSPNVAEDHQTKNARSLVDRGAALWIPDTEARQKLGMEVARLLPDTDRIEQLGMAAHRLARPLATQTLVNHLIEIATRS